MMCVWPKAPRRPAFPVHTSNRLEDPARPMSRFRGGPVAGRAEKLTGLDPQEGSAWHEFRQQADEEATLAVVLGGAEIREVGGR